MTHAIPGVSGLEKAVYDEGTWTGAGVDTALSVVPFGLGKLRAIRGAGGLADDAGRLVAPKSVANATPEAYAGVRQASQQLRDAGVPRRIRKQVLESFDRKALQVRVAGDAEFGIRYFGNINAWPKGRYLFNKFPATRNSLALPPDWNQMTHFRQFQIRPGTTIFEGPAARQGFYPGGQVQKYIADLDNLIAP